MTRRPDVVGLVVLAVAVAVGLALGLSGPDISPVFSQTPTVGLAR